MKKVVAILIATGITLASFARAPAPLIQARGARELVNVSSETQQNLDKIDQLVDKLDQLVKQEGRTEVNKWIKEYLWNNVSELTIERAEVLLERFDLRSSDDPVSDIRQIAGMYGRLNKRQKRALKFILRQIKTKYNLLKKKSDSKILDEVEATPVKIVKVKTTKVEISEAKTTEVKTSEAKTTEVETPAVDAVKGWQNVYSLAAEQMGSHAGFIPHPRSYFGFKRTKLMKKLSEADGKWWENPKLLAEWKAYWKNLGDALRCRKGR